MTLHRLNVRVVSVANTKRRLVDATLAVGAAARLKVQALQIAKGFKAKTQALAALPGSKVNGNVTGRKHTTVWYDLRRAGSVRVQLRLPLDALRRGQKYALSIVATTADGAQRKLVASFRLH